MPPDPKRFSYLPSPEPAADGEVQAAPATLASGPTLDLHSLPRGEGRMGQERTQLNIRIPTGLKRQIAARAALEGKTVGELVEELVAAYVERAT